MRWSLERENKQQRRQTTGLGGLTPLLTYNYLYMGIWEEICLRLR